MLPKYDLFMFGLTRSDFKLSSVSVAWAKEWAKTNRVFYIDRPFSFKDIKDEWSDPALKKRMNALVLGKNIYSEIKFPQVSFTQVTPRLSLPINFLPEGGLYHFLNKYNNFVVNEVIRKTIKDYDVKNYVFFNSFNPVNCPYISSDIPLKPLASIYQSLDEISQEPYIARHGIQAEFDAMKNCDIAIGTSTGLCDRHAAENGRTVHLLANAADYDTFENAINKNFPQPVEMKDLAKPVIIYTGHYSDLRLDHVLVRRICTEFKEATVLFVGTYEKKDLEKESLLTIPNLHFIGSRPIESLPAYLSHASVAIIPYKSNELTRGIYPLKINEYLAAGIPTVSSNFSNDINSFDGLIYLGNTHDEFIAQIKTALSEKPQEKLAVRMNHAFNNSWRMRITKLESIIEDFVEGRPV
jgi:glycosyltransferase involved in cell wall biosynthesis